ncbi:class I SAM-dependent methyltransferase [Bordetella sp. H567]|uniref:class I SAM-dependent methyltransferase n=1 Tax=Bordetella sp. H567 TaxID=1697043 RepID=UPI001314C0DE|nr:class I SAM-dependent methyltransferase [Bordetella sp. H567]
MDAVIKETNMKDFESLYQQSPDPWQVRTSWYEQRKRALLVACLPHARYGRVLELGCGNGETTRLLAPRCDTLIAVDESPTAIRLCEQALKQDGLTNVHAYVARLPDEWPLREGETCDLVVVSELAYYFAEPHLSRLLERCRAALAPRGEWVMCDYTKDLDGRPQPTPALHTRVDGLTGMTRIIHHEDEHFHLDIWRDAGAHGGPVPVNAKGSLA